MTTVHRFHRKAACRAIAVGLVFLLAASASAQILEIEEHWELAIGEADAAVSAPQATMVMSPSGDLDGQYFLFTVNCRNVPDYEPGGVQVQLWNGDEAVDAESWGDTVLDQT